MERLIIIFGLLALVITSIGCATTLPTPAATPGMAKKKIEKGVTTQEEIINLFGAPNLVTRTKEGGELWVYSNYTTVNKAMGMGLGALGGGIGGAGGGAGAIGGRGSYSASSSRSINLMIKFDQEDKVIDYYFSQLQY